MSKGSGQCLDFLKSSSIAAATRALWRPWRAARRNWRVRQCRPDEEYSWWWGQRVVPNARIWWGWVGDIPGMKGCSCKVFSPVGDSPCEVFSWAAFSLEEWFSTPPPHPWSLLASRLFLLPFIWQRGQGWPWVNLWRTWVYPCLKLRIEGIRWLWLSLTRRPDPFSCCGNFSQSKMAAEESLGSSWGLTLPPRNFSGHPWRQQW